MLKKLSNKKKLHFVLKVAHNKHSSERFSLRIFMQKKKHFQLAQKFTDFHKAWSLATAFTLGFQGTFQHERSSNFHLIQLHARTPLKDVLRVFVNVVASVCVCVTFCIFS